MRQTDVGDAQLLLVSGFMSWRYMVKAPWHQSAKTLHYRASNELLERDESFVSS
jgi:hypothetical protein